MSSQDALRPGDPAGRRATLREVADALGVSVATVSNAFNRPSQLSTALRERVLAESARRGLSHPDPAARSLRRGRSRALGVVYTDRLSYAFSDPGAVAFLQGISRECERAELELVLIPRTSDAAAGDTAVGRSVIDGVIVYSVADDDPVLAAARQRLPLVIVDQPKTETFAPWVGIDDEAAGLALGKHVLELGHRRIAVISTEIDQRRVGGPVELSRQQSATFSSTAARLRGYRRAAEDAHLPWPTIPVIEAAENSEENGWRAAAALLARDPRPSALLAMTDQLAIGAARAAHDAGVGVPADLSITGFDDLTSATTHRPPLTTVHQPHEEKGRVAASLLLDLLAGRYPAHVHHNLPYELRVRESTAPP